MLVVVQITLALCGYVVHVTTKGYYNLNSDGLPQLGQLLYVISDECAGISCNQWKLKTGIRRSVQL